MKTIIYSVNETAKEIIYLHAAEIIKNGGLVVFPTETVYGIGANALNKTAAEQIYKVKGRPSDNPLIVHIAHHEDIYKYTSEVSSDARVLIEKFWPGPLTLVMKKNHLIPNEITGGLNTVAIRLPSNEIALNIINYSNKPICAPSANISGRPSPTLFKHVFEDLNNKVDMIIDGGKSTIGLESTVLDLTSNNPTILRPGAITKDMIVEVLKKEVLVSKNIEDIKDVPKAPGMKYTHYSPRGIITVVDGHFDKISNYINKEVAEKVKCGYKTAVICASEFFNKINSEYKFNIGSINNPSEIAANLFEALREMDNLDIEYIYTHSFPTESIGFATMNRLLKAAGNNIVKID